MNDDFLTSQVIRYIPDWFVPIFQNNERICLPYVISIRDADDIIRATSSNVLTFHIEAPEFLPVERRIGSVVDFLNNINELIFQNAPCETVISFGQQNAWMYYDGDQRFSCLVSSINIIKDSFPNDRDTMKLYYIEETDDIALDNEVKSNLFEVITTAD